MAALYRKPHYSEARYNEVELYLMNYLSNLIVSPLCLVLI